MSKLRPPFKCHGGKYYLSSWIIENFPDEYEKLDYVEPYCGAASVFINKVPSEGSEVLNDMNDGIVKIFKALRDEPNTFIKRIKRTRYTERVFNRCLKNQDKEWEDYIDHAVNEFILRRMSRGGLKKTFAWSNRERGGQPGDVNAWETIIKQLPEIAERLYGSWVFNKPAIDVIKAFDDDNVLLYCDPPYLEETRTVTNTYEHEMSDDDHIELANALKSFKGKVVLSGYPSSLYKRMFEGWKCLRKKIANHASQQASKKHKTECLWLNF